MNTTNIFIGAIAALALVISVIGLVGGNDQSTVVGGGSRFQNGLSTNDTSPNEGDIIVGDDLIFAASTFCVDFFATSTATQRRMVASTTATIEGVDGVIMAEYGSCQ